MYVRIAWCEGEILSEIGEGGQNGHPGPGLAACAACAACCACCAGPKSVSALPICKQFGQISPRILSFSQDLRARGRALASTS